MKTKFLVSLLFISINWLVVPADIISWIGDNFADRIPHLSSPDDQEILKEAVMNTNEVCEKFGYSSEIHNVTTKDGFILTMFRIPKGKNGKSGGYPVLILHGLLASSNYFVDNNEQSIAFFLADNGYDVWLGNYRGNIYSKHTKYSRNSKQFWDFSWDEIADYDVPAMIDYILGKSRKTKLIGVGHSMGTTAWFTTLAAHKNYQAKVAGFIPLAPQAGLHYTPSFIRYIMPYGEIIGDATKLIGIHHLLTIPPSLFKLAQHLCPTNDTFVCGMILDGVGYDPYLRNNTRNFVYVSHGFAGASGRNLVHFTQLFKKRGLYRYDYGWLINLFTYLSFLPPVYDLKEIKIPVAIIYGKNDVWANAFDTALISRQLPNLIGVKLIDYPLFNHVDIGFASNASELFYKDFLQYLRKM